MGRAINYDNARALLAETFALAEEDVREGTSLPIPKPIQVATSSLFKSRTQAYREALVGCAIARIVDPKIDIRYPVAEHSSDAFSGRSLDEQVVNPLFQDRAVPVSRNPYLSAIRRGVHFVPGGASGQRDMEAFNALVEVVAYLLKAKEKEGTGYLRYLLGEFVKLRESANIPLRKIGRLSIEQYGKLADGLLSKPSGGLMPVVLSVAMFTTIRDCYGLDWKIESQGINVADAASGAGGDITVSRKGQVVFAVEVTERPIERKRVVSTFDTKISPNGLDDYLFFFTANEPTPDARAQAKQYFAQGHEINFISVRDWLVTTLTTLGPKCRAMFTSYCVARLNEKDVPNMVKQTWNEQVSAVAGNAS